MVGFLQRWLKGAKCSLSLMSVGKVSIVWRDVVWVVGSGDGESAEVRLEGSGRGGVRGGLRRLVDSMGVWFKWQRRE